MEVKRDEIDLQVTGFNISTNGNITVNFVELFTREPGESEDDSTVESIEHKVKGKREPHKDLTDSLKVLRKHGLAISEIDVPTESHRLAQWTVSGFKINGDMLMKQSRVVLTMAKEVKRTGKVITFATPEVVLYGESEYEKAAELAALIEKVIGEVKQYLGGKYHDESMQLPLFSR